MKRASVVAALLVVGMGSVASGETAAATRPAEPTLFVGDVAPPLSVSKWVKGEPIAALERGKVYVVEFWATWCGPCVAAIPHLSELQQKYKDRGVVMIGMDVEDDGTVKVPPMLTRLGDRMNYRVALDDYSTDKKGATETAWFRAAGERGIPCTMVVGRDGRLAWIGHPVSLGPVLEEIVAGTYDPIKVAGTRDAQLLEKKVELEADSDPDQALKLLDQAAAMPDPPSWVNWRRVIVLGYAKKDVPAALGAVDRAAGEPGMTGARLIPLVEMVSNMGWVKPADADRVLAVIDRAAKLPAGEADAELPARVLAARFNTLAVKRDYPGAMAAARALADSPASSARLSDVAWRIATIRDPAARDLPTARRLAARAAETAKSADDQVQAGRARIGVAVRDGTEGAVADAVKQTSELPAATPEKLREIAGYVVSHLGEGPAQFAACSALLDRAAELSKDPADREATARARFDLMFQKKDFPAAYAVARDVLASPDATYHVLNHMAWQIVDVAGVAPRDLDLSERLSARAVALGQEKDANLIDTYARVMFEKGDAAKAVELQTKALSLAYERQKPEFQKSLDRYKAKVAGK